jgi:predicted nucleotidyltransferase
LIGILRNLRDNLRIVRKDSKLAALFPGLRQGVLRATIMNPDRWWYLSELATHLGTSPSSLQRELSSLVGSGILQQRREGSRRYFRAQDQSPIFPELQRLFEKTYGTVATLRSLLQPFGEKVFSAFLFGSIARGEEHALSDIDLMVIGNIGLADLSPILRKGEARLGRDINVMNYSRSEFLERIREKDHFLHNVLKSTKVFVKGNESDLDNLAGKQKSAKAHYLKERTGRHARVDRS